MAAIGSVWATGTWATPAWAAGTWADASVVPPTPTILLMAGPIKQLRTTPVVKQLRTLPVVRQPRRPSP